MIVIKYNSNRALSSVQATEERAKEEGVAVEFRVEHRRKPGGNELKLVCPLKEKDEIATSLRSSQ